MCNLVCPLLNGLHEQNLVHPPFTLVLKEYHEKFPDNNVLKKWVLDVIAGAETSGKSPTPDKDYKGTYFLICSL